MATPLTEHFTLEEMVATQHRDIDNTAPAHIVEILRNVTCPGMEEVRAFLGGRVITVSSGYRCPELNAAVGGAANSAHMSGYACDFNCYDAGSPLDICRAITERFAGRFDQLIEEGTWVHISFAPTLRGEVLTKAPGGGYHEGLP